MIFEYYEQQDLYKIANCARQQTLVDWLNLNNIPFSQDSKGKILAHSAVVEEAFGVSVLPTNQNASPPIKLHLE